ncbi:type II toxin-antitoxin system HicB family antitoxin [Hydrogenophaga sp.]|uniref:type II toxin-antitoxin system HicB family antitoxin n=1 Tax=Hydrogenophaga sp. TaxID=1904254 RepID=UPI003F70FD63
MSKVLEHKGYFGSIEADTEEEFLFGRLLFIKDVISYRADDVKGIRAAFQAAVDDYLATCAELGEAPDTPCKGTFNVRLGPELHQAAALAATREGIKLNEWVKTACEARLSGQGPESMQPSEATITLQASFEVVQENFGGMEEWQTSTSNNKMH